MYKLLKDAVAKAVYDYIIPPEPQPVYVESRPRTTCIGELRGQEDAKIGILIAAYGRHDILMIGPPGEGKTFLASCLPGFLPTLTQEEINERYSALRSTSALRPFIQAGPTSSETVLIGGGTKEPRPGLITEAHGGILYLDELPHFRREVVDALRSPMEDGSVTITRGGITKVFPSRFQLIAAMNPCPCGYYGYADCICKPTEVLKYQKRISGPILDRIDMLLEFQVTTSEEYFAPPVPSQSDSFLARIKEATVFRELGRNQYFPNSIIPGHSVADQNSPLLKWDSTGLESFKKVIDDKPMFSNRKKKRLATVARSYADLLFDEFLTAEHINKVLPYTTSNILER